MKKVFLKESRIPAPAEVVFAWHERPDALRKLIPPGDPIHIVEHTGGIRDGARVVLRIGYGPFAIRWVALHRGYRAGRQFQDVQLVGPFRNWEHTHTFTPDGETACTLRDHVEYELPLSPWSDAIAGWFVRLALRRTFAYRHRITCVENIQPEASRYTAGK